MFQHSLRRRRLESALQHCSYSARPGHPAEPEGTAPGVISAQLGTDPVVSWAKDSSIGAQTINARAETANTKPAFRDALKSRRCLIPPMVSTKSEVFGTLRSRSQGVRIFTTSIAIPLVSLTCPYPRRKIRCQ